MLAEPSQPAIKCTGASTADWHCSLGLRGGSCARWLIVAMAVLSVVGCQNSASIRESSLIVGLVYGRVTNAAGDPVVNAEVHATAHLDSSDCRLGRGGVSGGAPVRTDARGYYRDDVTAPVAPTTLCVSVTVIPFRGAAQTLGGGDRSVRLTYQAAGRVLDSVNVDIKIP